MFNEVFGESVRGIGDNRPDVTIAKLIRFKEIIACFDVRCANLESGFA
jgi:hypothetical protein